MAGQLTVIAHLRALDGQIEETKAFLTGLIEPTRAEPGCIEYAAVVDLQDAPSFQAACGDDAFMVIEKWKDRDALQAHAASAHMAAYAQRTADLVASRTIHILSAI